MRCCEAWKPVENCFDPISFELSQIIANLTRENLPEREAEITNLPWTDRKRQCVGQMQNWTTCLAYQKTRALPTDEEGHPLENENESGRKLCEYWRTIFQARVEGPRHHQYEDIQRFVQMAPDDIRWTVDRIEFDELTAMKKDSGADGIPYGAYRCAGGLGSQFLLMLAGLCWEEEPLQNISLSVGRFLPPRLLTSMTIEMHTSFAEMHLFQVHDRQHF